MDTRTADQDIQSGIAEIKAHMPETYKAIQDKAGELGNAAYGLVRRGLGGEANCFYAIERGRVVGAPFDVPGVSAEVARLIVAFGCKSLVMWRLPKAAEGLGSNGAH
jgi:hypothetical protein